MAPTGVMNVVDVNTLVRAHYLYAAALAVRGAVVKLQKGALRNVDCLCHVGASACVCVLGVWYR